MTSRLMQTGTLALVAVIAACDTSGQRTHDFALSNLDPNSAIRLIEPRADESVALHSERPQSITVVASPERIEEIRNLLTQYDVPSTVQLRFQLIEADGFTNTDPAIAHVETVLRDLFRFDGYRLVTEAIVSSRAYGETRQRLVGSDGTQYSLEVNIGAVTNGPNGGSADLSVDLVSTDSPILHTEVVVPGGQTVVLGTARPMQNRGALILVVQPVIQ